MAWDTQRICADLEQRHGVVRKTFTLYPDRLQVTLRGVASGGRRFVPFEAIKDDPDLRSLVVPKEVGIFAVLPAKLVCGILVVAWIVAATIATASTEHLGVFNCVCLAVFGYVPALILLIGFVLSFRKVWVCSYVKSQQGLVFPDIWIKRDEPSVAMVSDFLRKLREVHQAWRQRREALKSAALAATAADCIAKFADLRRDGIITEQEFLEAKDRLLHQNDG
jgi:hypothetical protein